LGPQIYLGLVEEQQRLQSALEEAGVEHKVEIYPGVKHGFAVDDTPAYDRPAAELHWQRVLELFAVNLPAQSALPAQK
jgi:carboxymethylenebutenolidase